MKKIFLGLLIFLSGFFVSESWAQDNTSREPVESVSTLKPAGIDTNYIKSIALPEAAGIADFQTNNDINGVKETEELNEKIKEIISLYFKNLNTNDLTALEIIQLNPKTRKELSKNLNLGTSFHVKGTSLKFNNTTKLLEPNNNGEIISAAENSILINKSELDLKQDKVLLKIIHPKYFTKIFDATEDLKTKQILSIEIEENLNSSFNSSKSHLEISEDGYDSVLKNNIFLKAGEEFDGYEKGKAGNEEQILQSFFSGNNGLITIILQILGSIGILYLIIAGIRYIFSQGDEENSEKAKNQIIWALVGLLILSLAEFIGFEFINPEKDIIGDKVATTFGEKVKQIIRVLEYIVGGLFLMNGIVSAYNLVTSRGIEENLENEKNFIQTFIWGAGFILFAEVVVRIVASDISRAEQTNIIASEIGGIINFVLTFFAGAAALMMIIASVYYVASFGNEEQANKAKALIKNSAIAFVVAFSSYVIAQFIIV